MIIKLNGNLLGKPIKITLENKQQAKIIIAKLHTWFDPVDLPQDITEDEYAEYCNTKEEKLCGTK